MPRNDHTPPVLKQLRRDRSLGRALALLYLLLAALVGFSHRSVGATETGWFALCQVAQDDSGPVDAAVGGCDACQLTSAPGLLTPPVALPRPDHVLSGRIVVVNRGHRVGAGVARRLARGPPQAGNPDPVA